MIAAFWYFVSKPQENNIQAPVKEVQKPKIIILNTSEQKVLENKMTATGTASLSSTQETKVIKNTSSASSPTISNSQEEALIKAMSGSN